MFSLPALLMLTQPSLCFSGDSKYTKIKHIVKHAACEHTQASKGIMHLAISAFGLITEQ